MILSNGGITLAEITTLFSTIECSTVGIAKSDGMKILRLALKAQVPQVGEFLVVGEHGVIGDFIYEVQVKHGRANGSVAELFLEEN